MKKEEKAHMGQKIRTESSPDRSSHAVDMHQAVCGREMSGSGTDTSKSLKAGANNDAPVKKSSMKY